MKVEKHHIRLTSRTLVALAGLFYLIITSVYTPIEEDQVFPVLLNSLFIAFLTNYPLRRTSAELSMVHIIVLSSAVIYDLRMALLSLAIGKLFGALAEHILYRIPQNRPKTKPKSPWVYLYKFGLIALPLVLATNVFTPMIDVAVGGVTLTMINMARALAIAGVFITVHVALVLIDVLVNPANGSIPYKQEISFLSLMELITLPAVLLAAAVYPSLNLITLTLLAVVIALISILLFDSSEMQGDLERRVQDLSALSQISEAMRFTLQLDDLLLAIWQEVGELLSVDHFYIALYDEKHETLNYPLVIQNGERQRWSARPLANRLTDKVVLENKPIMIGRNTEEEMAQIGVPLGIEQLSGWMGVPLSVPERNLGCLAVYSYDPKDEFSQEDLNLLSTLAGQASVALMNAVLHEDVQKRAHHLEALNQTAAGLAADLNLESVFERICRSIAEASQTKNSAIFLIRPNGDIRLEHTYGLSEAFQERFNRLKLPPETLTTCMASGEPAITPDLEEIKENNGYFSMLREENIHACADFPLTTQDGKLGFLTVYFEQPHDFSNDEIELLSTFAAQAALAVDNARLYTQTDQALARRVEQLQILQSVSQQVTAATPTGELFALIMKHAVAFTESPWGSISLFDPVANTYELKASQGYQWAPDTTLTADVGIVGRVLKSRQPDLVEDVSQDPDYFDASGGQAKAQMTVPILYRDQVTGVIVLENDRPYSENEFEFIKQLADQAAIAIINAELYEKSQMRLHEQATLNIISTRLAANQEIDQITTTTVQGISAAINSHLAGIYLWSSREQHYQQRKIMERAHASPSSLPLSLTRMQLSTLAVTPIIPEAQLVTHFPEVAVEGLQMCKFCNLLIFPMRLGDRDLGLILAHVPKQQNIDRETLQLPALIAAQGTLALQNAQLFGDVRSGRDRMEALLNAVNEGVLMVNARGVVRLANQPMARLANSSMDELIGNRLEDLPISNLRALGFTQKDAQEWARQDPSETAPRKEFQFRERFLERTTAPVWGDDKELIGWVIVLRDVTEEQEASKARELFTETLVHDLRSPIGAVQTALALIEEELNGDQSNPVIGQSMQIADRSVQRVLLLITSMLDIGRLETGNVELNQIPVKLERLAGEVLHEVKNQAEDFNLRFQSDFPWDLPIVMIDHDLILRVITNLVDNALKFTPEGGQIKLAAASGPKGFVTFSVMDSGPGVPEEYRDSIFERFGQVPGVIGRRRGTGLGLTFCRLAVEAHGGRIWVDDRNEKSGANFSFTLPIE